PRFHDLMRQTAEHLMSNCGLGVSYAFSQSDEISLLFGPDSDGFGRKLRKLLSILAGEASARFSLLLGSLAVFDCRVSQLPTADLPRPRLAGEGRLLGVPPGPVAVARRGLIVEAA